MTGAATALSVLLLVGPPPPTVATPAATSQPNEQRKPRPARKKPGIWVYGLAMGLLGAAAGTLAAFSAVWLKTDGRCRAYDGAGECTDTRNTQAAGIAAAVGSAASLTGALVVVPIFAVRRDREDRKTATAATAGIGVRIQF